jgi:fucose 4-O-acetylase-like acetyltransferase
LRDPWLDNARWLAGSLIVTVHIAAYWEFAELLEVQLLHSGTWILRVPLFALLLGIFSTGRYSVKLADNLARQLILPLAFFTAIHLSLVAIFEQQLRFDPANPEFTLWFLYSAVLWRALLPIWLRIPWNPALAVAASVLSGFVPQDLGAWSLDRSITFFPYFVIGYWLANRGRGMLDRSPLKTLVAAFTLVSFCLTAVYLTVYTETMTRPEFRLNSVYSGDILEQLSLAGNRLFLLAFGLLAVVSALYLVPRRRMLLISYLGSGGLYIYLLHAPIAYVLQQTRVLPAVLDAVGFGGLVVFSFALAAALASKPVRFLTRPLVQPRLAWLRSGTKDRTSQKP